MMRTRSRSRALLLGFIAIIALATVTAGAAPNDPPASSPKLTRATYRVKGMACHGCAETLRERLAKVEGVSAVAIDFDKARATVDFDGARTDAAKLRVAIEKIGFKADQVPSPDPPKEEKRS